MPTNRKKATSIIDSRHLKVLAAKRADLRDAIVFICLSEDKYGHVEKSKLRQMITQIDELEPSGIYFPMLEKISVEMYDRAVFKNRDVLVTVDHEDPDEVDTDEIEKDIRKALPEARSVTFIHRKVSIDDR